LAVTSGGRRFGASVRRGRLQKPDFRVKYDIRVQARAAFELNKKSGDEDDGDRRF